MACNYFRVLKSKMWCSLGFTGYEQARNRRARFATASDASRAAIVARYGTVGGRPQGWGDTYDGERLEPASESRRTGSVGAPTARPAVRFGRTTASRPGKAAEGWGAGAGVCHGAVDVTACRPVDRGEILSSIQREPSVAYPGIAGIQQPAAHWSGARTRRGRDSALEACALAGVKKNARKQGRVIVFIDESGLSERPTQVRSWAPRGHTPVLQYHFNWHQLSAIAGITFQRFYFRLFPGAIKGAQLVEFLHALGRQIRRKVLVIWDGLPAHRSQLVRDYVESLKGAIQLEYLPAYAPELNPTEYIWGHLKQHELGNFCARTFGELTHRTRNRLRSMQRRHTLVTAFWQQAELPL
jgi:transposase